MSRRSEGAYVFDAAFHEVHVLDPREPAPARGTVTDSFRLRRIFFDEANAWARERLLEELEGTHVRLYEANPSHRELAEDELFEAIDRRFVVYEVPAVRPVFNPEKPLTFVPVPVGSPPVERPWIALELVDQKGNPVPGRPFRIVTADKQTIVGQLDDEGTTRIDGLAPGTCEVDCPYVEPRAATTHVVEAGEHASRIAFQYGFEDFETVWNHPQNADLKANRADPHLLVAGDEVFIPAIVARTVYRPTNDTHTFRVRLSPLKLRLQLMDAPDQPLGGVTCTVDDVTLTSDADGFIVLPIDKLTDTSTLTVNGISMALHIGQLNPPADDTEAGWKARLFNMGFLDDPAADDDEVAFALQDFQAQYGLDVSGTLDDPTTSKIKEIHGC